mgnify:FL=1|tara:strand:- start:624 stop:857 length:234 start_codon:yes stop_codon:yes gene_type:complete
MGNDYIFDEDDNSIEIDLKNVTWNVDMHGYPVYEDVVKVQADLKEQQLREQHPELKEAYENYAKMLAKYGFWEDITK